MTNAKIDPQPGNVLERDGMVCRVDARQGSLIEYTSNGEPQNAVHIDDWKLWASLAREVRDEAAH